jgi:hypothetical protein
MCRAWESECLYVAPCTTFGMSVCLSVVLITSSCLLAVIDVLRVLEMTASRLQEEQFQIQQISRVWMTEDTVSTNCGCPSRTLEPPWFKFALGFILLVPCFEKEPLLLEITLQFFSNSVVYGPTALTASKLVIVAWLIAYGAAMEPRATCGSRSHGCAARRALVSRLLTKHFYQVTP